MTPVQSAEATAIRRARTRTRRVTVAGLLIALLAASAYVSIPFGQVPITLQVFVVLLVALLLPVEGALLVIGSYLLLGAVGVPVFSNATAGLGVIFGPTGGYLLGFALGAAAGSLARAGFVKIGASDLEADIACVTAVIAIVYALGLAQLSAITGMSTAEAFAAGVVPFVIADVAKAVIAVALAASLRRAGVVGGS